MALKERLEKGQSADSVNYNEYLDSYRERFRDYTMEVGSLDEITTENPRAQCRSITLRTRDGTEYIADFGTIGYMIHMMKVWQTTGDNASGSYFPLNNFVPVVNLDPATLKKTIDDLIDFLAIDNYFIKQDK